MTSFFSAPIYNKFLAAFKFSIFFIFSPSSQAFASTTTLKVLLSRPPVIVMLLKPMANSQASSFLLSSIWQSRLPSSTHFLHLLLGHYSSSFLSIPLGIFLIEKCSTLVIQHTKMESRSSLWKSLGGFKSKNRVIQSRLLRFLN